MTSLRWTDVPAKLIRTTFKTSDVYFMYFYGFRAYNWHYLICLLQPHHVPQLHRAGFPSLRRRRLPGFSCRLVAARVQACLQTGRTRPLLWDKHKTQTSINKQIHSYTHLPRNSVCTRSLISEHSLRLLSEAFVCHEQHCLVRTQCISAILSHY